METPSGDASMLLKIRAEIFIDSLKWFSVYGYIERYPVIIYHHIGNIRDGYRTGHTWYTYHNTCENSCHPCLFHSPSMQALSCVLPLL